MRGKKFDLDELSLNELNDYLYENQKRKSLSGGEIYDILIRIAHHKKENENLIHNNSFCERRAFFLETLNRC